MKKLKRSEFDMGKLAARMFAMGLVSVPGEPIEKTVWVGAWMHLGRLGVWRFRNISQLAAVRRAKASFFLNWIAREIEINKLTGNNEPIKDPFSCRNSFGEQIVFRSSNKFRFACTKTACSDIC